MVRKGRMTAVSVVFFNMEIDCISRTKVLLLRCCGIKGREFKLLVKSLNVP